MENQPVYVATDNVITSLGFTTDETIRKIKNNSIGFKIVNDRALTPAALPLSLVDTHQLDELFRQTVKVFKPSAITGHFTRMEKMFILSIYDAVKELEGDIFGSGTQLILSTTKGNIDLLEKDKRDQFEPDRIYLWKMAEVIRAFFGFENRPLIVSNACISGVLALSLASRMIRSGRCENAVVTGGDIISEFVVSGFTSFQALSPEPCKPFDKDRTGLSLGEGCGTMVLTSSPEKYSATNMMVTGSSMSNDANHISGPSRTGEELAFTINRAMKEASIVSSQFSFISAHGTATLYNDEMESKALAIVGLQETPVNSFKGYWGHTLGGAGLIESVITVRSALDNILFRSAGFTTLGVPEKLSVILQHTPSTIDHCLKIASGFGGCNAAIIFSKNHNNRG
jgi:3-oxoacyl-[acyl-carrier-protein] synthase I